MSKIWCACPVEHGCLGLTFLHTKHHPAESCGTNGLPLTPNTTKVLGEFTGLQNIRCDELCVYIDILKTKHDKIILVQEHHHNTVWKLCKETVNVSWTIISAAFSILKALECLHCSGYQHSSLSIDNVLLTEEGKIRLSQYGLWTLTGLGEFVSFPAGSPEYLSPEVLLSGCSGGRKRSWSVSSEGQVGLVKQFQPSGDIWSFGIILLELVSKRRLWKKPNSSLENILGFITCLLKTEDQSAVYSYVKELEFEEGFKELPTDLANLIHSCLIIDARDRPTASDLLSLPMFESHRGMSSQPCSTTFLTTDIRSKNLVLKPVSLSERGHPLRKRSFHELYYLWKLAGGDPESELKKHGLTKSKPPICTLPRLCIVEGETFGMCKDDYHLYDSSVVSVTFDGLLNRLENIPEEAYYPLLIESQLPADKNYTKDSLALPLVIREGDIEYQLHRIILFERLLKGYPFTRDRIIDEARKDIPPLFRGEIWAAILGVVGDVQGRYEDIDKDSPTATDRQIEVDIPRCHQYIDLLASPVAHGKFKRILKAWIVSYPEYVYWQGLDSLCAPFLLLNFNDEALAYASLSAFIPKYLNGFFRRDNSSVMQEYLTKFSQLLAFHDPLLFVHLSEVNFVPELYAIPWFLTMFAHVFPLQKIFHLWDALLLGSPSFPLFVGLAILRQIRELLMASEFNECISYFSNMPEIDMERCLRESKDMWESTPPSATFREHELKPENGTSVTSPSLTSLSPRTPVAEEENEMGITSISLEELKTEKCLRISAEDFLNLMRRENEIIVVDVRQQEDYNRGAVPGSINLPFTQCLNQATEHVSRFPVDLAAKKTVAILGGGRSHGVACMFAAGLLKLGIHRVCVLHRGVDSLRKADVLILPS